jgi:hypothetical protein
MKTSKASPLIGVVLGNAATPAEAARIADRYGRCPFCSSFATTGTSVMGIYAFPEERRWWFERIAADPRARFGFKDAEVLFTDAIAAASPWTRGDVKPNLHPAPCGVDCRQCPSYGNECEGCPATLDYKGN